MICFSNVTFKQVYTKKDYIYTNCIRGNFTDIQWGEINIRTYEFFYFSSFKHSKNKIFKYIYCIRIYSTNMCI